MNPMIEKLGDLGPEIAMLIGATICLTTGLSASVTVRKLTAWVAAITLIVAGLIACPAMPALSLGDPASGLESQPREVAPGDAELPPVADTAAADAGDAAAAAEFDAAAPSRAEPGLWTLPAYIKSIVAGVGLLLLTLVAGVPDRFRMTREVESGHEPFEPASVMRGEFFAFFLLSLTGVMLCAEATDLVWLFLALELTSLPTYVMVATSRDRTIAQEAGVKYFFLGAMSAAMFLYGFSLIYGATGFTNLDQIRGAVMQAGDVSPLMTLGVVLAVVGIGFKIAAVPMHLYAADVYQGATTPVSAFLAFVPKVAGFVSVIMILNLVRDGSGGLPAPVEVVVWVMAVLTMTLGNVMGLVQTSLKRVLAYSSIAHSGYMLVALIGASPSGASDLGNGVGGVLFYLLVYGLGNLGAFAVLSMLERDGREADSYRDLGGLWRRRPTLAVIMVISVLSLIGLPPLAGFMGKIYLFGSAMQHGHYLLVVIAVLNAAISLGYYLPMAAACFFDGADPQTRSTVSDLRTFGASVAAVMAIAVGLGWGGLARVAGEAASHFQNRPPVIVQAATPSAADDQSVAAAPPRALPEDSGPAARSE